MAFLGGAALVFWHDVAPGGEAEFDEWHLREHIPERLGVPGFLRLQRYVGLGDGPRYFYFYETESLDTLRSPAYLARLGAPTEWTRRILPLYRNNKRTACRVTRSVGAGLGGVMATLEFGPDAGREAELRAWLADTVVPEVAGRPGMVGAHLLEADSGVSGAARSDEKKLLERPDELVQWVLLLEGLDRDAPERACRDVLNPAAIARRGAGGATTTGLYRLQYCAGR
jgi:hypothetical protein